jgi:TnpA family transposase
MPVAFLSTSQRESHGKYVGEPSTQELAQYFHLDDTDRAQIVERHGDANRLGFALQLTTVRFVGTFLDDPTTVPKAVMATISAQLGIDINTDLTRYRDGKRRFAHAAEIRNDHGYLDYTDRAAGFGLTRWLYAQCWTGTERPSALFERATTWMLAHKVLLPGATQLERFIAKLRQRVEVRLWRLLSGDLSRSQKSRLEDLLCVPEGARNSLLDILRSGPVVVSGPALVRTLKRLESIRSLNISVPSSAVIAPNRIAALARLADKAKVSAIARMPALRRTATLVAFVHSLEASAQDDALEILDILLHEIFGDAEKADRKARLRSIKDLDAVALTLAQPCSALIDPTLPDNALRKHVFSHISPEAIADALRQLGTLVRPPDDVFYSELQRTYRRVRIFLPTLLRNVQFESTPAGKAVIKAFQYLRRLELSPAAEDVAPTAIVSKTWQRYVYAANNEIDQRAYTFCVLGRLREALRHRDIFVTPSWRYADPRRNLLAGAEWEAARPIICRSLGYGPRPGPILAALKEELHQTYRAVAARLPNNPAVRFERVNDKDELILTPLDEVKEPASLVALREAVAARLPRVDLPEILLEISARTGFTNAFTHVSERTARAKDLDVSICAVLLAEACNTGFEPLVRQDVPSLRPDRLSWVGQNYLRDETLTSANACLVAAQNEIPLAQAWGGGEVASADGLRFVVPVRTVHAGPNPKYFGFGRGVTYYNLVSNQFTGLHGITVPGTLRDSLVLLAVVLEQQTQLQPTQIMTDTGAYSDVVFGLFRLAGYRFSPRIADVGGARFWRIDPHADYGPLNSVARQCVKLDKITPHWDDMLRTVGSLKLGRIPATGIMRTLQVGNRPTGLAKAFAEFGRIDKT